MDRVTAGAHVRHDDGGGDGRAQINRYNSLSFIDAGEPSINRVSFERSFGKTCDGGPEVDERYAVSIVYMGKLLFLPMEDGDHNANCENTRR